MRLQRLSLLWGVSAILAGCGGVASAPVQGRSVLSTGADDCYWTVLIEDKRRWDLATERGVLLANGSQSPQWFGSSDDPWQVPNAKYTTGWTIPYTYKSGDFAGRTVFFGLSSDGSDIAWWAFDATCGELSSFTPPQAP